VTSSIDARIVAFLLEENGPCVTALVVNGCNEHFGPRESDRTINEHIRLLVGRRVLIEFDPEEEGVISDNLFEHDEHGSLDGMELTPLTTQTYIGLGPNLLSFVHENFNDVLKASREGGLDRAGQVLEEIQGTSLGPPSKQFQFAPADQAKLLLLLRTALNDIAAQDLSNAASAQAKAYVEAALILAETPEPDLGMIWELIQRANNVAGIASLFVALVALFMAA
jgi:hypothetical protein